MNCMGPTARSWVVSPSYAPPSVSVIRAKPLPLSTGPRMGVYVVPSASTRPPRAWPDSTLPMAASSCQGRLQPGLDSLRADSAFLYASSTVAGMPASAAATSSGSPGRSMEVPGLPGFCRGGRSVWYDEPPSMGVSTDGGAGFSPAALSWCWSRAVPASPGACEAVRAAITTAATAVVAAPLRSRRPMCGAMRMSLPVEQ